MHHLIELATNPWIAAAVTLLFFGEYLPLSQPLWKAVKRRAQAFGTWFIRRDEPTLYSDSAEAAVPAKIRLRLHGFFSRFFFFIFSAVVVIFLEVFWELGFKKITRTFERSGIADRSRRIIESLPGWAVLSLFGLPFLLMELLGVFALGAFVSGHFWGGIALYAAKVLLFVPVHFILHAGRNKLIAIAWFKRRYDIITAVLDWFRRTRSYERIHRFVIRTKTYAAALKSLFSETVIRMKRVFEQADTLPAGCEKLRREILAKKAAGDTPPPALYEAFFDCMHAAAPPPESSDDNPDTTRSL